MENNATNSNTEKPKRKLLTILLQRSTLISAVIMSLINVQSQHIETVLNEDEDSVQILREEYQQEINQKKDLEENEEQLKAINAMKSEPTANATIDTYDKEEETLQVEANKDSVELADEKHDLDNSKENKKQSGWAETLSELGVLLSSVGESAELRILQYASGILILLASIFAFASAM